MGHDSAVTIAPRYRQLTAARRAGACAVFFAAIVATIANAMAAQFAVLVYHARTETTITCPANLECDVTLEPGEKIRDGFAASPDDWDPHATYTGPKTAETPHLVFRPARAGLRTNAIIPTSRRTYYFLLVSDGSTNARYYTFAFPKVFIARNPVPPPPTPSPAPVDPMTACLTAVTYTYEFDRGLPADHPTGARTNTSALTALWQPRKACTDGRHTWVAFSPTPIVPSDTPVLQLLGPEGDTLMNYTYDATLRRFRIDGVPEAFVLLFGSQASPLRLVVKRSATEGATVDPGAR